MNKKTTATPEAVKEVKEAAVKEVKEAAVEVTEEAVVEAAEEVKEAAKKGGKKEPVKETAKAEVKKAEPKKTESKKAEPKKADKKEEMKPEVFIQYSGREAVVAEVVEKAKKQFEADGHRASSIKSLQMYLKPEEAAGYYVINKKYAGRVDLF